MTLLFDFAEDPVVHVGQILQQPLAKNKNIKQVPCLTWFCLPVVSCH